MSFDLQNSLGIFPDALNIHEKRATVLANNLANQDTPNYKAQDLNFRSLLNDLKSSNSIGASLNSTHPKHYDYNGSLESQYLQYRISNQPSLDGNTVDSQIEQSEFSENAMRYLASLRFLNSKIDGIMLAIKGSR